MFTKKYLIIHSSIFHNSLKLNTIKLSINWWMCKQNVINYIQYYLAIKKEWSTNTFCDIVKPWRHYSTWKRNSYKILQNLYVTSRRDQFIETETKLVVIWTWHEERQLGGELMLTMYRISFRDDENVIKLNYGDGAQFR